MVVAQVDLEGAHSALAQRIEHLGAVELAALVAARLAGEVIADLGIAAEEGGAGAVIDCIRVQPVHLARGMEGPVNCGGFKAVAGLLDRKSTRLNSSH